MRVGSLFSGYAGLDQAVEQVFGAEPAWFVEYDDAPSKIRRRHQAGASYRSLAREYAISHGAIRAAVIGKSWGHVR